MQQLLFTKDITFGNDIYHPMKTWLTKNETSITRILFGRSNVFLISNKGSGILVDTGWSGDGARLLRGIGKIGKPDAVILTHTHFDHTGNAGTLQEKLAPVFIVQEKEKTFLECGDSPPPSIFPPWGDDGTAIITSWKKLLDTGCVSFHPAHGLPVSRQRLEAAYARQVTRHPSHIKCST